MKKIFFLLMIIFVAANLFASYQKPPYEPCFTDITFDATTNKLKFFDTYKPDENVDRNYTIEFYYRTDGTDILRAYAGYAFYTYGLTDSYNFLETPVCDPETGLWINQNFSMPHSQGGVRQMDLSEGISACLQAGEGLLFVAIKGTETINGKQVPFEAVQKDNPDKGCHLNNNFEVAIHNVLQLDLKITPSMIEYGKEYDIRLDFQGSDMSYYCIEAQGSDGRWYQFQSGTISTYDARKGIIIHDHRVFDTEGHVGSRMFRARVTDFSTHTTDTSNLVRAHYLYPWKDGNITRHYLPGEEISVTYPQTDECSEYKVTSNLPCERKEEEWKIVFYQPACPAEIEKITKRYTVKFYNADYTLLKTERVDCGSHATPPVEPTMPGMTFKQWSKDLTNVRKDFSVMAQYEMGSDYVFTHQHVAHMNSRYPVRFFAGDPNRAMVGDQLTFKANVRTPSESTLRYQQGLRDKQGNWTWGEPKTVGTFSAEDVAKGETKTFQLSVKVALENNNEMPFRYGEAYRFNLYSAGATILSEPYEFDVYYPMNFSCATKALLCENTYGDIASSEANETLPTRYGDTVRFFCDAQGACMLFEREIYPERPLDRGEDEENIAYVVAPGEKETIGVSFAQKAVVFDGAYPTQQYDFTSQGLGKYNAYYAEVVDCGGGVKNLPDDPTLEGSVFDGWSPWNPEAYDSVAYHQVPAIDDKYLGFSAKWIETPVVPVYMVRFFEKEGQAQIGENQYVNEGENAVPPVPPVVEGWRFVKWDKPFVFIMANTDITAIYEQPKGLESVTHEESLVQKVLREGRLLIHRGDCTYSILGQECK